MSAEDHDPMHSSTTLMLFRDLIKAEREARTAEIHRLEIAMNDSIQRLEEKVDRLGEIVDPILDLARAVTPLARFMMSRKAVMILLVITFISQWMGDLIIGWIR